MKSVRTAPATDHPAAVRYLLSAGSESAGPPSEIAEKIVQGDALDAMTAVPDNSVDLVHTSPPYNIERPYALSSSDDGSIDEYTAFLRSAIGELKRVVRPGGSVFWQTGYTQDAESHDEIIPIDFLSHQIFRDQPNPLSLWDRIIWRYWGGHAFTRKFTNKHETILWFVKPGAPPRFSVDAVRERAKEYDKRNNFWGRNPGNVWEVDRVAYGSLDQTSHIAVFPEELSERIIRSCSEPGDMVLDPFSGSGTVPKVARGLGRQWLGIEISPLYAVEAAVRIGFQQPSERDSLASEILKRVAFGGREASCDVEQAARALQDWVADVDVRERARHFEADVKVVFEDSNGRNHVKREVWRKYDLLVEGNASSSDKIASLADALLCSRYKLRRRLNGVSRYRSLLDAVKGLESALGGIGPCEYVKTLAAQEPSSYELRGDQLTLVVPQRAARPPRESLDAKLEAGASSRRSKQGRIL